MVGSIRCPRCNISEYVELRSQPESSSVIPKILKLKERTWIHCRGCGYYASIEDYKKDVLTK